MDPKNQRNQPERQSESAENQNIKAANEQAEKDMSEDLDLNSPNSENDDLDEGESARLGEDTKDII